MLNTHFVTSVALPVCVLAVLAVVLPLLITPKNTRSQRRLAISVMMSVLVLLVIGAAFMAVLYLAEGADVGAKIIRNPLYVLIFFSKRSGMAALIWGPLLALAWFGMAQKIERLKGKDGMRIGLGRGGNGGGTPEATSDVASDTDETKPFSTGPE